MSAEILAFPGQARRKPESDTAIITSMAGIIKLRTMDL